MKFKKDSVSYPIEFGVNPIGVDLDQTWWSDKATGIFEAGFDLDLNISLSGDPKADGSNMGDWWFFHESVTLGPALGFNFHPRHTLRLTPGIRFAFDEGFGDYKYSYGSYSYKQEYFLIDFYGALAINAQYHFWISESFALNIGTEFEIPIIGYASWSTKVDGTRSSNDFSVGPGFGYRIFAGVTFRQHQRSIFRGNSASSSYSDNSATSAPPPVPGSTTSAPPPVPTESKQYNVILNGKSSGPYDTAAITQMIKSGLITRDTLVWRQGLSDWVKAGSELSSLF